MPWSPRADALRAQREQRGHTFATLAAKAAVTDKTLWRLETGRTRNVRSATLTALARALDCALEEIATWTSAPAPIAAPVSSRRRSPASAAKGEPRRAPASRPLTPLVLVHLEIAFRAHQGRRFDFLARVREQSPLSDSERIALACDRGVGARFLVHFATRKGAHPVDVFSVEEATTRLLQANLGQRACRLVVMMEVVESSADHRTLNDADRLPHDYFRRSWRGFSRSSTDALHPWALVVRQVGR